MTHSPNDHLLCLWNWRDGTFPINYYVVTYFNKNIDLEVYLGHYLKPASFW